MRKITLLKITPSLFFLVGITIALFSFLTKGTIEPFNLLAFMLMGIFEIFFRKQNRIPSNLLSFFLALALVLILKLYIIDFKVMKRDIPELGISKNARVFYQPSMFKLHSGDLIIYLPKGGIKYSLVRLKNVKNDLYEIEPISIKEPEGIPLNRIKGKVIFISQKP